MKISINFLLLCFLLCFLFSCKKDDGSLNLLRQAQNKSESEPMNALSILDSIQNPQNMDKGNYMDYIVTLVQVKQKMQQDITNDTLIFEAQQYFDKKNNLEKSALAHYYAGRVYRAKKLSENALNSFLQSKAYALQFGNNILAGKNDHIIGNLYLEQGIIDTAIVYYREALHYYNEEENTDTFKLQVLASVGRSYESINKLDSAYLYFNKGLDLAVKINDEYSHVIFLQNLGVTLYGMKEYEKALEYFQSALSMKVINKEQINQICLYLLKTYNKEHKLDLVKQYADSVKVSLHDVTYIYTLKEMYSALADYNKQIGDYKQALFYTNLENEINQKILEEERPLSLLAADKNFHLDQKNKQVDQLCKYIFLYLLIGIVVCFVLLIFSISIFKIHKRDKKEIKLQEEKYRRIKDQLLAMAAEYKDIEAEIAAILLDEEDEN